MFRSTLEAQNGSGSTSDAKHHQYASDEIHCTTSVGLTRIELVTSSLLGESLEQWIGVSKIYMVRRLVEGVVALSLLVEWAFQNNHERLIIFSLTVFYGPSKKGSNYNSEI